MEARFCDIESLRENSTIQFLDVEQFDLKMKSLPVHKLVDQSMESERIVGAS
jgi:hypothetical protein